MKLYFLPDEKRYVHRLSDVPKGVVPEIHDIATDLAGLMEQLNRLHEEIASWKEAANNPAHPPAPVVGEIHEVKEIFIDDKPIHAAMDRKCDVEEAIQNATPLDLASYAQNVCLRIRELANG